MAEKVKASGVEYLTALVADYEVMSRIAKAVYPGISRQRTVHGKEAVQSIGATVAAGKLLGFDAERNRIGFTHLTRGERGFWIMLGFTSCDYNIARALDYNILTDRLGKEYYLMDPFFYMKKWSFCRIAQNTSARSGYRSRYSSGTQRANARR